MYINVTVICMRVYEGLKTFCMTDKCFGYDMFTIERLQMLRYDCPPYIKMETLIIHIECVCVFGECVTH